MSLVLLARGSGAPAFVFRSLLVLLLVNFAHSCEPVKCLQGGTAGGYHHSESHQAESRILEELELNYQLHIADGPEDKIYSQMKLIIGPDGGLKPTRNNMGNDLKDGMCYFGKT